MAPPRVCRPLLLVTLPVLVGAQVDSSFGFRAEHPHFKFGGVKGKHPSKAKNSRIIENKTITGPTHDTLTEGGAVDRSYTGRTQRFPVAGRRLSGEAGEAVVTLPDGRRG
jgi:hypothetical protein